MQELELEELALLLRAPRCGTGLANGETKSKLIFCETILMCKGHRYLPIFKFLQGIAPGINLQLFLGTTCFSPLERRVMSSLMTSLSSKCKSHTLDFSVNCLSALLTTSFHFAITTGSFVG